MQGDVTLHPGASEVINALTFDVEDWFHGQEPRSERWPSFESRLAANLDIVLELLAEARVRATFFVLGCVAESQPQLVRDILAGGHELGTHGWGHAPLSRLTRPQFREELRRSLGQLQDVAGREVRLHRAAYFTVTEKTSWALEELVEAGVRYDSSIFPIRHYRCGIASASRFPHPLLKGALIEFPMSTMRVVGINLPFSGGFYLRALPYAFVRACFAQLNGGGHPAIAYFHPWEFDPSPPRAHGGTRLNRLSYHHGLATAMPKLRALLHDFRWAPMCEVLGGQ